MEKLTKEQQKAIQTYIALRDKRQVHMVKVQKATTSTDKVEHLDKIHAYDNEMIKIKESLGFETLKKTK